MTTRPPKRPNPSRATFERKTTRDELERKKILAETEASQAEAKYYLSEGRYYDLQSQRLERSWHQEQADMESQRILDFTAEVTIGGVRSAINTLAEWRQRDPEAPILVRLFTPGGDVVAAMAFYDYMIMLRQSGTPLNTMAIGWAASAGTLLLQGGEKRLVTPHTWLMVHEISGGAQGRLSEIIDEAKFTERMQDQILNILADRTHLSRVTIKRKWVRKDWWLDSAEAVKSGFADQVVGEE